MAGRDFSERVYSIVTGLNVLFVLGMALVLFTPFGVSGPDPFELLFILVSLLPVELIVGLVLLVTKWRNVGKALLQVLPVTGQVS